MTTVGSGGSASKPEAVNGEKLREILRSQSEDWHDIYERKSDISAPKGDYPSDHLLAIHSRLYNELDQLKIEQRQWLTWALAIVSAFALFGGGLISTAIHPTMALLSVTLFAALVVLVFVAISLAILSKMRAQKGLMQNIDRTHRVMGVFEENYYYEGSTLLDPEFYGWGYYENGSHERFAKRSITLIWLMVFTAIAISAVQVFLVPPVSP